MLEDPRYLVPSCPVGTTGMAWLRGTVPRFCDGPEHGRRRAAFEATLGELRVEPRDGEDPTTALLRALGLDDALAADVDTAAGSYQPHLPVTPEADEAVERLVVACGAHDERSAMRICVLVQAHTATRALIDLRRRGDHGAPTPSTRRVDPDGNEVAVDLADAHFGRGVHACPGRELALRLVEAALR